MLSCSALCSVHCVLTRWKSVAHAHRGCEYTVRGWGWPRTGCSGAGGAETASAVPTLGSRQGRPRHQQPRARTWAETRDINISCIHHTSEKRGHPGNNVSCQFVNVDIKILNLQFLQSLKSLCRWFPFYDS